MTTPFINIVETEKLKNLKNGKANGPGNGKKLFV